MRKVIFAVLAGAALPSVALAAPGGVPGAPASHPNGRHVGPPETSHFGQGGRHVGPAAIDLTAAQQTTPAVSPTAQKPGDKGKSRVAKAKLHGVAYIVRGVISADAASDAFTMSVRRGNRHIRRALDGADSVKVALGESTRIVKFGMGRVTFTELKAGDRVLVMWKAPRKTAAADLPAARFVIDIGPAPAAPAPAAPAAAPADGDA